MRGVPVTERQTDRVTDRKRYGSEGSRAVPTRPSNKGWWTHCQAVFIDVKC